MPRFVSSIPCLQQNLGGRVVDVVDSRRIKHNGTDRLLRRRDQVKNLLGGQAGFCVERVSLEAVDKQAWCGEAVGSAATFSRLPRRKTTDTVAVLGCSLGQSPAWHSPAGAAAAGPPLGTRGRLLGRRRMPVVGHQRPFGALPAASPLIPEFRTDRSRPPLPSRSLHAGRSSIASVALQERGGLFL